MPTATVTENGISADVTVPDGLSDAEAAQQAHVAFQAALPSQLASATPQSNPSQPDASIVGSLEAGAGSVLSGVGKATNVAGTALDAIGLPTAGGYAHSAGDWAMTHGDAMVPKGYVSPDPVGKFQSGDYKGAAYDAVRAGASAAPFIGAAVVDPLLGAGLAGTTAEGDTAYARAQNNGRSAPTLGDAEAAIPTAAVEGGLGLLPGGKLADGAVGGMVGRTLAHVGIDAATAGGMDVASQVGATADTNKGLSVDPKEAVNAAVGGAAAGVGIHTAGLVPEATKAGVGRLMTPDVDPANAPFILAAGDAYDRSATAAKNNGTDQKPTAIANSAKTEIATNISRAIGALRADGTMTADDAMVARATLNQAVRHNNTIGTGNDEFSTIFDDLKQSGVDPAKLQPILDATKTLNVLSTQSFLKNQTGPFQKVGRAVGGLAGAGVGAGLGIEAGPVGMAASAVLGGGPGHYVGKVVGGKVGGAIDNALGLSQPQLAYQRLAAARQIGDTPVPDFQADLSSIANSRNPRSRPDPQTGNAPDPIPVNTPIPAADAPQPAPQATAMKRPTLTGLKPNSPQDVREALRADDGPTPPPTTAQPLATPPDASTGIPGGQPSPVWSGAHQFIANGSDVSSEDIHGAIDRAVTAGRLSQEQADAIKSGQVNMIDRGAANEIQRQLPKGQRGQVDELSPIRDPQRYQMAADAYHQMATNMATDALAQGHPEAAAAIHDVAHTHGKSRASTHALKHAKAHAHIAKHPHHAHHFTHALLTHGPER